MSTRPPQERATRADVLIVGMTGSSAGLGAGVFLDGDGSHDVLGFCACALAACLGIGWSIVRPRLERH